MSGSGALNGYRLRSAHGDTIDPRQPLPVDTVEAQETSSVAPTLTYNGKAAAGAVSISSLPLKPVIENLGSRVGSYWGEVQNKVYSAYADGNPKKEDSWLLSVTETATAAAITIYDPNKNLEEMFESVTGTVKRFIVKVYDKDGGTLYGWVRGISVASDVYTFEIMNNRLTETQSWVGTLSAFDNTALDKVEIYFYNSSLAFGTGTCFTEEVECPKEYSKNRELQLRYAETLSNGQYFVDYMRGELIGVRANNTASETVTYNVWSSTVGGSSGPSANVNLEKVGGTATNVNGGNRDAGTQTVTLADNDPAVASLGIMDDWDNAASDGASVSGDTAHDAVDAGEPVGIGGIAASAQRAAVAAADRVKAVFNLFGEMVIAGYTWATNSIRTEEIDPLDQKYVPETLLDLTNIAQTTTGYGYIDMAGAKFVGIQAETSGTAPTDVLTVTLEATCQDDGTAAASCSYQDATTALTGSASFVDTDFFAIIDTTLPVKYLRVKYVTSTGGGDDCDLTVYTKKLY